MIVNNVSTIFGLVSLIIKQKKWSLWHTIKVLDPFKANNASVDIATIS